MSARHTPVLVIGSGPAGYTAAIYAARALLHPVLIEGSQPGGQLTITTDVENYPGFAAQVQGPWLMDQMRAQAVQCGAAVVQDRVVEVDLSRRPFRATLESGGVCTADALIVATGAQARWLGLPDEGTYRGAGVSACATCDGFFYRGQDVVVVGGGNTAVEEALYLSNIARSVTLVHRRDRLRAERVMQERLAARPNVAILYGQVVEGLIGETRPAPLPPAVAGVRLRDLATGALRELAATGLFVAIGHAPAVELFVGKLRQKPNGYLWTAPDSTATDVPGVFAAGDVADDVFRQAVTAAGMGCMAALEAERFLAAS
ncbi:MAG: thioredoxin-disulfide reductase [Devosia sp. 67-54]|uniref:thioredoxin-disulfide reductase n=1 Tax=unclassified Devosia TaxID=196773 RepID=UPI000964B3BD|nr:MULTISPECIES: thioredoxin-disulfide reductase [unclassified Devosia]MBN9306714.1 thioredoxin-disulfide reductase [Devosia sp.]OJX15981.1 MAG: thioredoxin-disulfide reductase [Devosia sp. 67-54]